MSEIALIWLCDCGHRKFATQPFAKVTENAAKGNAGDAQLFGPW